MHTHIHAHSHTYYTRLCAHTRNNTQTRPNLDFSCFHTRVVYMHMYVRVCTHAHKRIITADVVVCRGNFGPIKNNNNNNRTAVVCVLLGRTTDNGGSWLYGWRIYYYNYSIQYNIYIHIVTIVYMIYTYTTFGIG